MNPAHLPAVAAPAVTRDEQQEVLHDELRACPSGIACRWCSAISKGEHTTKQPCSSVGGGELRVLLDRGRERLRPPGPAWRDAAGRRSRDVLIDGMVPAAVPSLLAVSTVRAAVLFAAGKTLAESGIAVPRQPLLKEVCT